MMLFVIIGIMLYLVIGSSNAVLERLGVETRTSLKSDLVRATQNLELTKAIAKSNEDMFEKVSAYQKLSYDTIIKNLKYEQEVEDMVEANIEELDIAIEEASEIEVEEVRAKEVRTANIEALWNNYHALGS